MSDDKFSYKKELDDLIGVVKEGNGEKAFSSYEEPDTATMESVADSKQAYEKQYQETLINKRMIQIIIFIIEFKNYDFKAVNNTINHRDLSKEDIFSMSEERLKYFETIDNVIYKDKIPRELIPQSKISKPPLLFHSGDTSLLKNVKDVKMLTLNFENEDEKVSKKLKADLELFFINCKLNETTVVVSSNEKYSELALKIATKCSVKVINLLPHGVNHIKDCENEFNILNITPFINDKKIDFNTIEVLRQYKNNIKDNFKQQVFDDINKTYKKKKSKSIDR